MNIPSPLVAIALLAALGPPSSILTVPVAPTATPDHRPLSILGSSTTLVPAGETLQDNRIAALEKQIATLQAEVKAANTHVHTVVATRGPNMYMSILDVRNAMVPHSPIDITQWWIPMYAGARPDLAGYRAMTSGPQAAP